MGDEDEKKKIIIPVIIIFLLGLGIYLFRQPIHMPTWMTYPYEVTVLRGYVKINAYISEEKEINIPKRILGMKVNYIEENAFDDLGTDAFIQSIPEGIYAGRIYHQESMSYYKLISDSEARLIEYTGNEKEVEIPEEVWGYKVTMIYDSVFQDLDVEKVVIPEVVIYIGGSVFEGCKNLKQVTLPSSLEYIGVCAFMESGIEWIKLPETVEVIDLAAFQYSAVKEVLGLENVEYIGNWAFRGTPWEESIEGDFVCIGDALCLYRGSADTVVIPATVKEIKGAFATEENYPYPNKVEEVFIPDTVTVISEYSFDGQDGIRVYIPETVVAIGVNENASLEYHNTIFYQTRGTIITTEGSPAEAYAMEKGIPYEIITKEEMQKKMEDARNKQSSER